MLLRLWPASGGSQAADDGVYCCPAGHHGSLELGVACEIFKVPRAAEVARALKSRPGWADPRKNPGLLASFLGGISSNITCGR